MHLYMGVLQMRETARCSLWRNFKLRGVYIIIACFYLTFSSFFAIDWVLLMQFFLHYIRSSYKYELYRGDLWRRTEMGDFGAEPGQVQQGPGEGSGEGSRKPLVQSQVRFNGCRRRFQRLAS